MSLVSMLLISIGVAADACACSIARGTLIKKNALMRSLVLAAILGIFQMLMPIVGWVIGYYFAEIDVIRQLDHWIAFALLAAVGIKMIWDAFHPDAGENVIDDGTIQIKPALLLGFATSIDALAVGMGLAFVEVSIIQLALLMGSTTFLLSLLGAWLGYHGGGRFGKWATLLGGLILIGLGLNILVSHLME